MSERNYQPKGGMCATCRRAKESCAHMDFASMPVHSKQGDVYIVICKNYRRAGWNQ